jgi:riboflavin synthase
MFTGIVTDIGEVFAVDERGEGLRRVRIGCAYQRAAIAHGASISCAGICLTVVETGEAGGRGWFAVDAAAETLRLTTAGQWRVGTRLNLERALRIGDEIGGHLVTGHVDGLAELLAREDLTEMARLDLRAAKPLMRFIAAQGSVTLDGISLTVNEAVDNRFSVLIIPHTLKVTTLGDAKAGDQLNLEVDMMARYAARLSESRWNQ